jgi:trk system potassium uptake protein TrkA
VLDSFELNSEYSIIEAKVPEEYVEKTIREVGFKRTYGLLVLTIIKKQEIKSLVGKTKIEDKILGVAAADEKLEENDVLVLFGTNKDLQKFLRISNL